MIRGSCLCGEVRFEYARAVARWMCHCSLRKVSALEAILVPETGFERISARGASTPADRIEDDFCGRRGSPLPQSIAAPRPTGSGRPLGDDPVLPAGPHLRRPQGEMQPGSLGDRRAATTSRSSSLRCRASRWLGGAPTCYPRAASRARELDRDRESRHNDRVHLVARGVPGVDRGAARLRDRGTVSAHAARVHAARDPRADPDPGRPLHLRSGAARLLGAGLRSASRATTTTGSATSRRASSRRSSRARSCCARSPLRPRRLAVLSRDCDLPRDQRVLRIHRMVGGARRRRRRRRVPGHPGRRRGTHSGTCFSH